MNTRCNEEIIIMRFYRISSNHYHFEFVSNLKGSIKMNPRSGLAVIRVTDVPANLEHFELDMRQLSDIVQYRVGGNIILVLPPELNPGLNSFKPSASGLRFIDSKTLEAVVRELKQSFNVKEHLKYIVPGSEVYQLLEKPKHYSGLYEKLFQFKLANGPFVCQEDILAGLASAKAEEAKINNEFVKHFALCRGTGLKKKSSLPWKFL